MNASKHQRPARNDPAGLRERRVTVLKDLVEKSAYEVPSEDVAASIIRNAVVIGAPSPSTPPQEEGARIRRPEHSR